MKSKGMTSQQIISIHNKQSGVKLRAITSKFQEEIEEVRYYINEFGCTKPQAITAMFIDCKYKFSDTEAELFTQWVLNYMK